MPIDLDKLPEGTLIELKHWPRAAVERMFAESALKETPR